MLCRLSSSRWVSFDNIAPVVALVAALALLASCGGQRSVGQVPSTAAALPTPAIAATSVSSPTTPIAVATIVASPAAAAAPIATVVSPQSGPTASASPSPAPIAVQAAPTARPGLSPAPSAPAESRRYVFPVRSAGKVSYGRSHHDYPAADIFCPAGSEFVAVADGVVDFVSREDRWDPRVNDGATRGGLAVAIVGDDGVRYYGSHLSAVADGIEPGVRVAAGQQLGLTGNSGDARFVDPHLHFGISHPTTPDDWQVRRGEIPPYTYLKAWQHGENVTPVLP